MNVRQFRISILILFGISSILTAQLQHPPANTRLCIYNMQEKSIRYSHQNFKSMNSRLTQSAQILSDWTPLGRVTNYNVLQTSIASDGKRLLVHYRRPRPDLNQEHGIITEWTGSQWVDLVTASKECHDPDLAVEGDVVAACWRDDDYDYGFCSNINGPWVVFSGTMLQHQWGMKVTIAHGLPYMTFACRYSDGMPSSYMMLHIIAPIGPGNRVTLKGGWRVPLANVGTNPAITGNRFSWYSVFEQKNYLWVMRGYYLNGEPYIVDVGDGFRVSHPPHDPEIAQISHLPVVAWLEESGKNLYVATYDGTKWILLGSDTAEAGYFYSLKIVSFESSLYVCYACTEGSPRISISRWEDDSWYNIYGTPESNSRANIPSVDLAVYRENLIITHVEDNVLKVSKSDVIDNVHENNNEPVKYLLNQNYPNPFNPSTNIEYTIATPTYVELSIYNLSGQRVDTLVKQRQIAGRYTVTWYPPQILSSGIYFYRLQTDDFSETKKLLIQR